MPKRNSTSNDRGRSTPTQSTPRNPPADRLQLLISLTNLQLTFLPSLRVGEQVILVGDEDVRAKTPLGTHIGDVADLDAEKLQGKVILGASIHQLGLDPPKVVLEVVLQ